MKIRLGVLVLGIFFVINLGICFYNLVHAEESSITWSCSIHINELGGKQDDVVFGEAPDAGDGPPADSYDVVKPPTPIPPYVKAIFNDNLPAPYDSLWKDYRQYPDAFKIWNLTVQWMPSSGSSSTTMTISWLSSEIGESEYTSINLCTDTGAVLTNMMINESYSFNCPAYTPQNFKIRCERNNNPPGPPSTPTGEITGYHGTPYAYATSAIDPEADDVYFQFDWGDSVMSSWLGPYPSGQMFQTSYTWYIPGKYQVKVHSKDLNDQQSPWSTPLSVEMQNRIPTQPINPSPQNGAMNVQGTPMIIWTGSDPDGDILSYTVNFDTTNPPQKLIDNQSGSSFHPGTLHNETTYYWKITSWDGFGGSISSPVWSFTTQASEDGPEPPENDTNQTNQRPIADASLSEQKGFVGAFLIFNGSRSYDPDGYLTKWRWDFGDGTNGSGERTIHTYQRLGVYSVTLTVTDDDGETGTDTISVEASTANWPPTPPIVSGTRIGIKNQAYVYTFSATDADNDFLQYMVNWGDETQNTSMFLPNGTTWSVSHSWAASGKYRLRAKATDNGTFSEQALMEVFIDVSFISTLGFLFDADNNGLIDSFFINDTGAITSIQKTNDGSYYLDTDGDGKWNYLYNPSNGSLTPLRSDVASIENPWFFIIIICVAIVIIGVIVYLYKKNYF